ncbi:MULTISPECIES: hypothetical protein [Comamonas]|uniref:hypothetical protein n=1 Tax=Comamonas TaxID=283 RepID=UPI0001DA6980|nr:MULTISPECIES: hypothetical protein [Comamonas]EFI62630.1 hypothetical protein CTS44_06113 [Comamonas thiooxydans]
MMADKLLPALALALLASLSGNAVLGWAYLGQRDRATSARANTGHAIQERDGARGTAQACSDGVGAVAAAAATQQAQAAPALAEAAAQAQTLNKRADSTLATAPGPDACASMQNLGDEWLKGRAQ